MSKEKAQLNSGKSPHRILVIEDNPADTALLRHALAEQAEPYHLEVLTDGEAALNFVRAQCGGACLPEPCLIVLDLHLPRYDGATVLRAIRSEPELAQVRVAILTTADSPAEKAEVLALGVQAYRRKPMNWDEMVDLACELIEICNQPLEKCEAQKA
jgi:chemotaxis family two-component system response regulator Rcp1